MERGTEREEGGKEERVKERRGEEKKWRGSCTMERGRTGDRMAVPSVRESWGGDAVIAQEGQQDGVLQLMLTQTQSLNMPRGGLQDPTGSGQ